jgi:amino acid transporter
MSKEQATNSPHLDRVLGPWMATALVVGTVIGSGVFKKPNAVAMSVPTFSWAIAAWIFLGVLVMCGGLALTEVIVLLPRAGGNYVYLREGYGPLWGFLWGWVDFFMVRSGSIAALAAIFAESVHSVLKHPGVRSALHLTERGDVLDFWPIQWLTVITIVILALVNIRGVRWGGGVQFAVTTVKVGSLLFIAILPFVLAFQSSGTTQSPAHWDNLTAPPYKDLTWVGYLTGFASALIAVQWAYHGWTNLGPVGGEVKNPQRNVPIAVIGGIGILIFLYCSANVAYSLVLTQEEMASEALKSTPVAAEFARRLLGPTGGALIAGAIAISTFGALNGNLLVGPRTPFAMAKDGLLPRRLAAVHPRFHTPVVATVVMTAWSVALVLIGAWLTTNKLPTWTIGGWTLDPNLPPGKALFDVLTDYAMFGAVVFETMAVASVFPLRRKLPDAPRPYRCIGYPWVPAFYVLCFAGLTANYFIDENKRLEGYCGVGFALLGAAVYGLFLRNKNNSQTT